MGEKPINLKVLLLREYFPDENIINNNSHWKFFLCFMSAKIINQQMKLLCFNVLDIFICVGGKSSCYVKIEFEESTKLKMKTKQKNYLKLKSSEIKW